MKFLSLLGNSLGCSASGERLVSAARDGDIQEAKALLDYNPRLARYSTFGVRNSPLHYSAAHGHHEIVALLLESGVDINLRNYRGQTALMQACQHGHWEVVQTLVLFKANIHKVDCLTGSTALHVAALNGHSRCIRLLLADYIPSIPNCMNFLRKKSQKGESSSGFRKGSVLEVINRAAGGGITALHMAALNGHVGSVHLLLDLGASVSKVTNGDGTTIDLIGGGSTPLHYAACGGNTQCCQILIARGASVTAKNANGRTPLMVASSWHRNWLEEILSKHQERKLQLLPSPYLCIPLKSIFKIAREYGWRSSGSVSPCVDPCVVCLERKCAVAVQGCDHEFCTRCALYLCSTNNTSTITQGPPGSIACPLCRHGIISFVKLPGTKPLQLKNLPRTSSLPFSLFSCSSEGIEEPISLKTPLCKPDSRCAPILPTGSSFRSLSCQRFLSLKVNSSLCLGDPDTSPSLVLRTSDRNLQNCPVQCSRSHLKRSTSHSDSKRSWLCSLNQCVESGSRC